MKASEKVDNLIRPTIVAMGYELWGAEYFPQGQHSVLRVYIDIERGINVDDCEKASRQISALLDVEDPIHGTYSLEVSSPGLERPLYTLEQFEKYLGEFVKVKVRTPVDGHRNFRGELLRIENDGVVIFVEKQEFMLPLSDIEKANLLMRR